MEYNKLRDQAYQIAVQHGFYQDGKSLNHYLAHVTAELGEAYNAHRQGWFPDLDRFTRLTEKPKSIRDWVWRLRRPDDDQRFYDAFEACIKDTVADELADAVLCLLSLSGHLGVDFDTVPDNEKYKRRFSHWSFAENKTAFEKNLLNDFYKLPSRMKFGIDFLVEWSTSMTFCLEDFIHLKMRYNKLRPMYNGKQY